MSGTYTGNLLLYLFLMMWEASGTPRWLMSCVYEEYAAFKKAKRGREEEGEKVEGSWGWGQLGVKLWVTVRRLADGIPRHAYSAVHTHKTEKLWCRRAFLLIKGSCHTFANIAKGLVMWRTQSLPLRFIYKAVESTGMVVITALGNISVKHPVHSPQILLSFFFCSLQPMAGQLESCLGVQRPDHLAGHADTWLKGKQGIVQPAAATPVL